MTSLTLEQRRALDLAKEALVPAAESLLERGGVASLRSKDFGQSQLRNLIAVAMDTESPAVVANFIRYQMGRDGRNGHGWSSVPDGLTPPRKLGELFLDEIEGDGGVVPRIVEGLAADLPSPLERQLAKIELVRQLLGFASRYMKFIDLQRGRNVHARGDDENGEGGS